MFDFASEDLLAGERAARLSANPQPYGFTVCAVFRRRRYIFDVILRQPRAA